MLAQNPATTNNNGFKEVLADFRDWFKNSPRLLWLKQHKGLAFSIPLLAVAILVLGFAGYRLYTTTPSAQVAPLGANATAMAQEGYSLLRKAYEQDKQERNEVRAMINTHTGEIRSVKEDLAAIKARTVDNPKALDAFREDLEALKKAMAIPPVKLIPMSALEGVNKTS